MPVDTHLSGPAASYAIHPGFQSQIWYPPPCTLLTTTAIVNNELRLIPYPLSRLVVFDAIGVYQAALGADATAQTRLGIYGSDINDMPGNLILDAGAFNCGTGGTGATANAAHTILFASPLVLPAGFYWLAAVTQGNPTTAATLSTIGVMDAIELPLPSAAQPFAIAGLLSGVTGPLPYTTGITTFAGQTGPRVMLRML